MRQALSIFEEIRIHLPEIKRTLDKRWPDFADQMRAQAASFEDISDEDTLKKAANQLYGLFMRDETAREIITRPLSSLETIAKRYHLPWLESDEEPPEVIELDTIANRFYWLCEEPDEATEAIKQDDPAEFFDRVRPNSTTRETNPKRSSPHD